MSVTQVKNERSRARIARHLTDYTGGVLDFWRSRVKDAQFVYLVSQALEDDGSGMVSMYGPVKIGFANDPIARVAMLQCGNPARLVVGSLVLASMEVEAAMHRRWHDVAIRGEWFDDDSGEIGAAFVRIDSWQREAFKDSTSLRSLAYSIPIMVLR